jgi:subtilisin family serine protease
MNNLFELIRIQELMKRTKGSKDIKIGLIDGPVQSSHQALAEADITLLSNHIKPACKSEYSLSCIHGTFMAGILSGNHKFGVPGICPACPLIVRSVFNEDNALGTLATATIQDLSNAMLETIRAGANIINLSLGTSNTELSDFSELDHAFDYAFRKQVLIFAATGNQGKIGITPLTKHPWLIPVTACDLKGHPYKRNNLGITIGKKGIMAPGVNITSTIPGDQISSMSGTSVAVPFVSATAALLWSIFPKATASDIQKAMLKSNVSRKSIIPPLLDGEGSYMLLKRYFPN